MQSLGIRIGMLQVINDLTDIIFVYYLKGGEKNKGTSKGYTATPNKRATEKS